MEKQKKGSIEVMETQQIINWLRDKAVRSGNHSWERMMMMAAKRLEELDLELNRQEKKEENV